MKTLKTLALRWGHVIAAAALFIGTASVNIACSGWAYQPEVPHCMDSMKREELK